jgi:hypothetical protein
MLTMDTNDGHQVVPRPRWGHGLPPHPELQALVERGRADYERLLDEIAGQRDFLHAIGHEPDTHEPLAPYWNNIWFTALDAAALVMFLLTRRPKHYFEVGSGNSTMFANRVLKASGLTTVISSIDPQPRTPVDSLCHRKIRAPLENCNLGLFGELHAGDILFIDGSHRVFTNSDVTVFFLEVLPRLEPGILIHIHDIFLPSDYPQDWEQSLFAEQYMLAAMMLCGSPPFRVVLPNYFICTDAALAARVRAIFMAKAGQDIPFAYPNALKTLPTSFWIETTSSRPTPSASG